MIFEYLRDLAQAARSGWNRFWFSAVDPATTSLIRLLAGSIIFYAHLVWTLDLSGFFGATSRISPEFVSRFHDPLRTGQHFAWSFWTGIESPVMMWIVHIASLIVLAMFMVGWFSRITSVLTFMITLSYTHRVPGTLFGLDQINSLLAMYLMLGPCGARFSVDRWIAKRRGAATVSKSVTANISVRLIQVHLCVIYLFAGLGKLQGISWWEGTAMWLALANYEYQTIDMTWLRRWPWVINGLSHLTVAWELSYIALIWPRLTRPIMLALAVPLHMGIALCLGMITFGLIMLVTNIAFIRPGVILNLVGETSDKSSE